MIFSRANFGTLSTSLLIQACGAATGILTARLLGPASRGELATVILWPVILSNLGLMGCNWVLAQQVARNPSRELDWAAAGFYIGLVTAFVYFLIGYVLIPILLPSDRGYLLPIARLCLWLIPLDISNQVLLAVDHGRMRWRRYNLLRLSFFLFYLALIVLIGLTRNGQLRWFIWAFLTSHLLTVLVRIWIHRRALAAGKVRSAQCRYLLREGVPYFGATISNLITLQLDTVLVVSLLSTPAAGIYAVAGTFANGQASLGDALGITSFAVVSNEADFASRGRIIAESFRQSALLSSGVGLLLVCLIPLLVKPLFGAAFDMAIWPAVILAAAASLTGSSNILNQGLRGAGRPHAGLVSQLLGTGVMALTALLFLRRFGLMGIASAVMLSSCVQVLVLIAAAARWLQISPLRFWPFGGQNVRLFWQQLAAVCLRVSRSPA
ncbi:MAG TPA: oligosaccharide flippase family protein [Candidatus Acidoferrales bacterium]|nr:oligosaccharide flippase family protein [Candidatus Acidoferrales bacterium]